MTYPDLAPVVTLLRTAAVLWAALFFMALTALYVPDTSWLAEAEPVERSGALQAIWVLLVVGYGFYLIRNFIWRPFCALLRAPRPPADVWRLVVSIMSHALPWGLLLAVALHVTLWFEIKWIIIAVFVGVMQVWDWVSARCDESAVRALHAVGLATDDQTENGSS